MKPITTRRTRRIVLTAIPLLGIALLASLGSGPAAADPVDNACTPLLPQPAEGAACMVVCVEDEDPVLWNAKLFLDCYSNP